MMQNAVRCAGVIVAALGIMAAPARAQIRASEVGSISQVIDGTKVTMQYSRPRVRGREPLFGTSAVHWGEVWTPGANWATTLETDKPITLDGHAVPKGKYSVWFVVRESGDWTMVLDPRWKLFHMRHPDSTASQVRFPVHVREAPFTEILTWSMPDVRMDGGTLAMQWAKIGITVNLGVTPSLATTMPQDEARPYLGRYDCAFVDSTGYLGKPQTLVVDYENGTLKAQFEPMHPYFMHFALVRLAPDWFAPAVYDKMGVLYEVLRPDVTVEFTRVNGRPMTFEWRDEDDKLLARGTRKP